MTAVDISPSAIALCKANAARNGIEGMEFLVADVFALLEELGGQKKSPYDFIILDLSLIHILRPFNINRYRCSPHTRG